MRTVVLALTVAASALAMACGSQVELVSSGLAGSAGAGSSGAGSSNGGSGAGGGSAGAASAPALAVQEWGTFTSVQGPEGVPLGGLHHEDEKLPLWVYDRINHPQGYYVGTLPSEPIQQLETPVLYFWSQQQVAVHVQVGFPQGVVGQWYPRQTSMLPNTDELSELANGAIGWDVIANPALDASSFAPVEATEIWAPSRRVASTPVQLPDAGVSNPLEAEQFIFYRGLGTFEPAVHVLSDADGTLHIRNDSSEALPAVFLLRASDSGGNVLPLGALAAQAQVSLAPPRDILDQPSYFAAAGAALHESLVGSGLNDDVAQAMVDTWTRSWFGNVGLRVLYLAPRAWADAWLPTQVTPAPTSFVRTLVGRIEIITPSEDDALVGELDANAAAAAPMDPLSLGRFAEPRLRHALSRLTSATSIGYANGVLSAAHALN